MRLRGGSDDVITEPVTGIGFSATLTAGNETLTFVGCGDRKKAIIGPVAVNVYAVGLYVDADAAKGDAPAILRSGAQAAARALQQGEAALDADGIKDIFQDEQAKHEAALDGERAGQ